MSTTTFPTSTFAVTAGQSPRVTALRSEWTKLRTLRSTWLTMAISIAAAVALSALATASDARDWDTMSTAERLAYDATSTSLIGVLFGALVLGAIGVRSITAEYSTGMIRTSAAAVPVRGRILWSKVAVVAVVALLVALVANVVGFAVGQALLARENLDVALTEASSVRAIVAGAVAVSSFTVIGIGLGTIVRRASVANILMALVVIGGQLVGTAMPASARKFLPFNALQATVSVKRSQELLPAGTAVAFIVGYAVAAVLAASFLLRRRDV